MVKYNHSLKKNMLLNAIKQALSLLFPLISFPYVSQHLGADSFGIYNFTMSILSYLTFLATMGVTTYAIREGAKIRDNQDDLNQLCSELFSINLVFTLISYVVLFFIVIFSKKLYAYKEFMFVLSVSILFNTIGTEWVNEIFEDFGYLTYRYIIIHVISIVLIFLFIHDESDLMNYCVITVLSSVFIGLFNTFHRRKYVHIKFTFNCKMNTHIKPMFVFFCSSIASVIYVNSDIIIIGVLLSTYDVGIYSFAVKIYNIVKITISTIISTAIARLTFYYSNDNKMYIEYLNKIYAFLSLIILPVSVGLITISEDVIFVLGHDEYSSGDATLSVLAIAMIFALYGSFYYSMVLIIRGEEKIMLYGTIIAASINIILNFMFIPKYGVISAAITTVLAETCCYLVAMIVSRKKYTINSFLDKIPLIYSIIISVFIVLCWNFISIFFKGNSFDNSLLRIILIMFSSASVYSIMLLSSKNKSIVNLKNSLFDIIRKKCGANS